MIKILFIGILSFIYTATVGQELYSGTLPDSLTQKVSVFNISQSELVDSNSKFYYKTIEKKFQALDTSISSVESIALTNYLIAVVDFNPAVLDSLGMLAYQLNENKEYNKAISTCRKILQQSANNITGHKEMAYAYNKIGKLDSAQQHLAIMEVIINSVFEFGNGTYNSPWLLNNFFEGVSIYEAAYKCNPRNRALMLDKQGRLLGGYNGYSAHLNKILIFYSNMSHWKKWLSEEDYIKEGEY